MRKTWKGIVCLVLCMGFLGCNAKVPDEAENAVSGSESVSSEVEAEADETEVINSDTETVSSDEQLSGFEKSEETGRTNESSELEESEPQIAEGALKGGFRGFVVSVDGSTIIIDEQKWVDFLDEEWKEEYDQGAGFEVVDISDIHASYTLSDNCKFSILDFHWDPRVEITYEEFISYQEEHGESVLWYFEEQDGEIVEVGENYRP
ncbi:MAG: hypothetical protein E7287_11500 [Lachnospiraceae bacterium]|nr:hypothetical protein [Lachnospiraceae bacterium]